MGRNRFALAVVAGALLVLWQMYVASKGDVLFGDFRAFYCAGSALAHGSSPYAAASLYACEVSPSPFGLYHASAGVSVPAPLPGYALLVFALLSALPYVLASIVWLLALLATSMFSALALARLVDRPMSAALCALSVGFAVSVIPFGELASIEMAAVLWFALEVRRGRLNSAAVAAALTMILPHVGLPAVLGAFCFAAALRVRLILTAAILGALDVAAGGTRTALAYVTQILPAHARAEIGSTVQYGSTWMLHALGASDRTAIVGGEIWYGVMIGLGLLGARSIFARVPDKAFVVLLPAAFAVLGGTFIHFAQIMVAIPAAFLLYDSSRGAARNMFAAAALLLMLPWLAVLGQPALIAVYAVAAAAAARSMLALSASAVLRVTLACVLLAGGILVAASRLGAEIAVSSSNAGAAAPSWAQYMLSHSSTGAIWWIVKAPTWIGLLLLAFGCAYALTKKDLVALVAVEQVPVAL